MSSTAAHRDCQLGPLVLSCLLSLPDDSRLSSDKFALRELYAQWRAATRSPHTPLETTTFSLTHRHYRPAAAIVDVAAAVTVAPRLQEDDQRFLHKGHKRVTLRS